MKIAKMFLISALSAISPSLSRSIIRSSASFALRLISV